jgi:hypothetical protein
MLDQKTMVDIGILIHAHGHNRQIRHLLLESQETGQFFDAGSAKGCPKIQHNDMSAQLIQVYCPHTVAYDELRRRLIDVSRMTSPIASGCHQ